MSPARSPPAGTALSPCLRYAMLCGDDAPVLFEQGDIGMQIERHSPWIPEGPRALVLRLIKGAAGPASLAQVKKFTNAIQAGDEGKRRRRTKLGVDLSTSHAEGFRRGEDRLDRRHDADDGGARDQERGRGRRRCAMVGAIGERGALGVHEVLQPGRTENS